VKIDGAPIPADWWAKRSDLKRLEKEMDADPAFKNPRLDEIRELQFAILKDATAPSLSDGRYDALTEEYCSLLAKTVNGPKYQAVADYYAERDRCIGSHIAAMIDAEPGARITIGTGADHRAAIVRMLRGKYDGKAVLDAVP
jgi:hypothetical protein